MKAKTLLNLLVAAVILVALAVWSGRDRTRPPGEIGRPVLQGLALDAVARVVVSTPAGEAVIARKGDRWFCEHAYGYPADFAGLQNAVRSLADLKIGQVLTLDPAMRADLKLYAPGDPAVTNGVGAGTRVSLQSEDGTELAGLLIGAERRRQSSSGMAYGAYPDGQYVSADDGRTACAVTATLYPFTRPADAWLDKQLLNVTATDVHEVTIAHPDLETLVLTQPDGESALTLEGLGADETLETAKASSARSALSYLRMENVADPALSDAETGLDAPVVFRAVTTTGEVYTVQIGAPAGDAGNRYARIHVEQLPTPEPPAADAAPAAPEDAAAPSARTGELAALDARLSPWVFILPAYKAEAMTATREQLVKPTATEDDETGTAGEGAEG